MEERKKKKNPNTVTRAKEGHYIMIKESIQ